MSPMAPSLPALTFAPGFILIAHRRSHGPGPRGRRGGAAGAARRGGVRRRRICTHYGGPLGRRLARRRTVRCPWHHACFSLRTGAALRAPALRSRCRAGASSSDGAVIRAREARRTRPRSRRPRRPTCPRSIVIVGGGAAGNAAAETLRREGYAGRITHAERRCVAAVRPAQPVEGLSRGQRARGLDSAAAAGVLRASTRIDLKLDARVDAIDTARRHVQLADGTPHAL